jgi:hypothetical protein
MKEEYFNLKTSSIIMKITIFFGLYLFMQSLLTGELIHQWKFEETGESGTILKDSIGNANGTIVDAGGNNGVVGVGKATLSPYVILFGLIFLL